MPVHFQKPEPHIVIVDEQPIRLHFKRMTITEFEAFNAVFSAMGRAHAAKPAVKASADGAAADEGPPVVQIAQLVAAASEGREHAEWMLDVFERYITVQPGDLIEDDVTVTSGRRFLELMVGQNGSAVASTLGALWLEHKLTPAQKKTFRLGHVFGTGSTGAPSLAIPGATPGTAVRPVESATSAPAEAAMGPSSATSSGTTGRRRSSGSARSGSSRRTLSTSSASSTAATRPS